MFFLKKKLNSSPLPEMKVTSIIVLLILPEQYDCLPAMTAFLNALAIQMVFLL